MDRLDPLFAELDRSAEALRDRAERFEVSIREAMLRIDEEPSAEHRARRMDYLMALHYIARKGRSLAEHDEQAADRWQAISDRFMDRAYRLETPRHTPGDTPGNDLSPR